MTAKQAKRPQQYSGLEQSERCLWEALALLRQAKLFLHPAVLDLHGCLVCESARERTHAEHAVEGLEAALVTAANAASYVRLLVQDQRERNLLYPQVRLVGG